MSLAKFLSHHANDLANIADTLALIMEGMGLAPKQAETAHKLIEATRQSVANIHAALEENDKPRDESVKFVKAT